LKGEQNDWDLHLGCLTSAYRSSESESTGLTHNMLMLGREVRTPFELLFGCRAEAFVSYGDYVAGHMDPYTEAVIWYKHPLSFVHVGTILHHLVDSSLNVLEHHKYLSVF
jgi:hypothetical protein